MITQQSTSSFIQFVLSILALPIIATASVAAVQLTQDPIDLPAPVQVNSVSNQSMTNTRSHNVQNDENGNIYGRIVVYQNSRPVGVGGLNFDIVQAGRIITSGSTAADGRFIVSNLTPGGYGIQAQSGQAVIAFGFTVAPRTSNYSDHVIEAAAVSAQTSNLIKTISAPARTIPQDHSQQVEVVTGNRIKLHNGVLRGRVRSMYRDLGVEKTTVELRQKGVSLGVTTVDNEGRFQFENIKPGFYEFLATGSQGYAAIAFEAVDTGKPLTEVKVDGLKDTSTSLGAAVKQAQEAIVNELEVVLLPQQVIPEQVVNERDDEIIFIDDSASFAGQIGAEFVDPGFVPSFGGGGGFAGGGGGFGGGGFGGFGGGGLGGGRLLTLAALGIGIAALADDNNSGGAPPTSPFNP